MGNCEEVAVIPTRVEECDVYLADQTKFKWCQMLAGKPVGSPFTYNQIFCQGKPFNPSKGCIMTALCPPGKLMKDGVTRQRQAMSNIVQTLCAADGTWGKCAKLEGADVTAAALPICPNVDGWATRLLWLSPTGQWGSATHNIINWTGYAGAWATPEAALR